MSGSGQGERHSEERLAELLRDIEGQKGIQGFPLYPLVQSTEVQVGPPCSAMPMNALEFGHTGKCIPQNDRLILTDPGIQRY